MKKKVLTILLVLATVGVLIFAYLVYDAILIEKNTESLPLLLSGLSICFGFSTTLLVFSLKNKKGKK
jgi:hypothetical protein